MVEEPVTLRYGKRTQRLWTGASKQEVADVLAEISSVAKDAQDRLAADFHEQDLYMAFEAFHLPAWAGLVGTGPGGACAATPGGRPGAPRPEDRRAKRDALVAKAKRCCNAVAVVCHGRSFFAAVLAALDFRRRAPPTEDPRCSWARVCCEEEHEWLRPVVALYVTHPDGTGDVERGLGLHARLRGVHLGADGNSAAGEICAEIHAEGPAEEKELFQKSDTGVLVFNTFGRRLAELWFERHGRRFATYRKRSDAGKRQPPERLRGTMKGVSIAQKAAAQALMKKAAEDDARGPEAASARRSLFGARLVKLQAIAAAAPRPTAIKALRNFRATTAQHLKQKAVVRPWAGFGAAPQLRRKIGAGEGGLVLRRRGAEQGGLVPQRRDDEAPPVALCSEAAAPGAVQYRSFPTPVLFRMPAVLVYSLHDLEQARLDDKLLLSWLHIVALGKTVRTRRRNEEEQFSPSLRMVPHNFALTSRFRSRHSRLALALRTLCSQEGSKWVIADAEAGAGVDTLGDLRARLVSLRRLPQFAGVERSRGD